MASSAAPPIFRIDGKTFERVYPLEVVQNKIADLAHELNQSYEGKNPILLPIFTGAYMFFGELVARITFPYQIMAMKLSSYGAGTESSGRPVVPEPHIPLSGRHIIVLEDIVDSGNTLMALDEKLKAEGAASIYYAALLFKPGSFQGTVPAHWVGFEIGNEFVIGYGLDYGEKGRHLRGIYQLVSEG